MKTGCYMVNSNSATPAHSECQAHLPMGPIIKPPRYAERQALSTTSRSTRSAGRKPNSFNISKPMRNQAPSTQYIQILRLKARCQLNTCLHRYVTRCVKCVINRGHISFYTIEACPILISASRLKSRAHDGQLQKLWYVLAQAPHEEYFELRFKSVKNTAVDAIFGQPNLNSN